MPDTTHTFRKPWMSTWLHGISTLRPVDQAAALWLAYLADKDGNVDFDSWDELAYLSGLQSDSLRKMLRPGGNSYLPVAGLVERHVRTVGGGFGVPRFTLHLDRASALAERNIEGMPVREAAPITPAP